MPRFEGPTPEENAEMERRVQEILTPEQAAMSAEREPFAPDSPFIPKKWFEPVPVESQGRTINLSHPAKVAYLKLSAGRAYDRTDLIKLAKAGELALEDVDDIRSVLDAMQEHKLERAGGIIDTIAAVLRPGKNAEGAFFARMEAPIVRRKTEKSGKAVERIRTVAEDLAAAGDFGRERLREALFKVFGLEREHRERVALLEDAREMVPQVSV